MAAQDQSKFNPIAGTRVLITGGTSGLGFAVAEAALESDAANVIIASSQQRSVDGALKRLGDAYPSKKSRISGHVVDLADPSTLEKNIVSLLDAATEKKTHKLDHIVHSAGDAIKMGQLKDVTIELIQGAGSVRQFASIFLGKYADEYMNSSVKSSLTLTSGSVAERPMKAWTVPGAFATFLYGLTRGLALDLAPIRVNAVSPGFVDTAMWNPEDPDKRPAGAQMDGFRDVIKKGTVTGTIADADTIAHAYLYVMKDYNVCGQIIGSNGGCMLIGGF